ncbi:hypothetical protein Aoki45_01420 [Algoriphagus sp. oki45]|uniref:hypothetical protein n=1 Tax=Algoriphagus sp. oki45 TaxID=3067294 RepID=UPI0027EB859C|nr:hypothetical protein Aoki45_01420 [Algoriphagus sp. oki45]
MLARLFFLFLFSFSTLGFSQTPSKDFILLKRGSNQKSQIRFYPGEMITYKSKKLGYFITDKIERLDNDFIFLTENIISPNDIEAIEIRQKDKRNRTLRNLTALFLGSGVLLFSVETINSIYQDEEFEIDSGVATLSAVLVGTGLALVPLRYKTFKNQGDNRIQIIIMRMD